MGAVLTLRACFRPNIGRPLTALVSVDRTGPKFTLRKNNLGYHSLPRACLTGQAFGIVQAKARAPAGLSVIHVRFFLNNLAFSAITSELNKGLQDDQERSAMRRRDKKRDMAHRLIVVMCIEAPK